MLAQDSTSSTAAAGMAAGIIFFYCLFILAILALSLIVNWRIAVKAGYPGPYSLLMLIPFANLIFLLIFAFTDWPIEIQMKAMRAGASPTGGPPPFQPPMQT